MIRVPLRARDGSVRAYALIDDVDEPLMANRWSLGGKGYAVRTVRFDGRRTYTLALHRAIFGLERGDPRQVDHVNGVRLDCRRSNLRIVPSHAENRQNVGSLAGSTSKYRGVSWHRQTRKWRAVVKIDGVTHWLGRFDDEDEAGRVAAEFRKRHVPYSVER